MKELSEIERCQGLHNCKLIKHNWVNFVLCNYTSGTVFEGGKTHEKLLNRQITGYLTISFTLGATMTVDHLDHIVQPDSQGSSS